MASSLSDKLGWIFPMTLSAGDRMGPYQIVERIGAGGMGEVYRAVDSRMGRDVAMKVSAEQFSDRFSREVRAVASLNHPNVCTLHDVGENCLVMELIEGSTLAERIADGPIPLPEALGIARQIAAALDAAHEKGIVHRDLKPGNIKIQPDGVVKVLDFGLAKLAESSRASTSDASPTVSLAATQAGFILGTAAYMSPEQARGRSVDKRADIWAFGVVLHEMLTGRRLFDSEDLTETVASIVKDQPDLSGIPMPVRRLLERCLEKDPKKRLRDIGDMELLLVETPASLAPPSPSRSNRFAWALGGVGLALGAAVVLFVWAPWHANHSLNRRLTRLDVDLGEDVSLPQPGQAGSSVAISRDGTRLAYVSGNPTALFIRRLDQPRAVKLPGTEDANYPFFSPDGQWVGFSSGRKLNKTSVDGGAAVPLGEIFNFSGANWGEDGGIIAGDMFGRGLVRFSAAGGPSQSLSKLDKAEAVITPQVLQAGKTVLFTAALMQGSAESNAFEILTLPDHRTKTVGSGGGSARYIAGPGRRGHLIYLRDGTMFAVPFDLDKQETHGNPVPVLDDVAYNPITNAGEFDFSPGLDGHGLLLYRRGGPASSPMTTLEWLNADGKREPLPLKPGPYGLPRVSPDGKRIVLYVATGGSLDIWVYDLQHEAMTRLTFGGGPWYTPIWSPDSRYIVVDSLGKGIFQVRADGATPPETLLESKEGFQRPWSFTPDGRWLAYDDYTSGRSQIWILPVEERGGRLKAGRPQQLLRSNFDEGLPSFSPDGRWVAYQSNESGTFEIYVRPFPQPSSGSGGKWQVSNNGGRGAQWAGNGHDLIYRSGSQIMAVSCAVRGDTFVTGKPRVWIANSGIDATGQWTLAPDGKRVLTLVPVKSAPAKAEHEVVFLENFVDYLQERVPAGQ
jgi:serine/threonine protein kinase